MQRKSIFPVLLALAGFLFIVSCEKEDTGPSVTFKATLSGASETPPNASTATGDATLTFNKDTKIFTIVVNYSGMTASNGHIHNGAAGAPGGVVFGFANPLSSPINYTSPKLTSEQEADLNAGLYYVNIHSSTFPDGEIRGQLTKP